MTEARDLFAAWLEQGDTGSSALDALCRLHPEHAELFRRLHGRLGAIGELDTEVDLDDHGGYAADTDGTARKVGPYAILDELGRGAQAVVYLAEDTRLGRRVALKVLPPHVAETSERLTRFRREAESVSRIDHPGICTLYEAGTADGVVYLAMRHVEGSTLAEWMAESRPLAQVVELFEKAARALHAAHECGLIHRDVKPTNIMVGADGEPVVLDFGLARDADDDTGLTLSGDLLGTPAYMSPEQIAASRIPLDRRTDVYSLGATLYEALTQRRPFDAPTIDRLFQSILSREPELPHRVDARIPADLSVVVMTCLDKDRNRRYATALDLAEDLRRVRDNETIRARRASTWTRVERWVRRNPLAATFVVTLAVSLTVMVVLWMDAAAANAQFSRVATAMELRRALTAEAVLYPAWPNRIGAMQEWLRQHEVPLARRRADLEQFLARLDPVGLDVRAATVRADTELYLREQLRLLVGELVRFERDVVASVRERIDWAERVEALSIEAHRDAWDRDRAKIAADPRYGFELPEQTGLVPLGQNPTTKLFEFLHLRSAEPGVIPVRDSDGFHVVTADTGIVFVLIPPGELPESSELDGSVDAFFIGAHEITKAQWRRLARTDDVGYFDIGRYYGKPSAVTTEVHPVEYQSWVRADEVLRQHGLSLPSEIQWEYACRAESSGEYSCEVEELGLHANLPATPEDQHRATVPVRSLEPNRWGCFDMHGNVFEWTLDLKPYTADGDERFRVIRGGSFASPKQLAKSSKPVFELATDQGEETGLRAARPILPR